MESMVVQKRYRLVCNLSAWELFGSVISWFIITAITLGLALPFCVFHFFQILINSTEVAGTRRAGTAHAPGR